MTSSVAFLEMEGDVGLQRVGRKEQRQLEQEEKGSYIENRREGFVEGRSVFMVGVGQGILHLLLEMTRTLSGHSSQRTHLHV